MDAAALAERARARLDLPQPKIGSAPPMGGTAVVRFPIWLWIDAEQWQPRSARVSVRGGSASVTAVPREVSWDMGDGSVVACSGPGTVFDPVMHTPGSDSPDCGHVYRSSSKNRPGGRDTVEATVVWEVSWESSSGQGGQLEPLETSARRSIEVVELHSVVVEG